MAVATGSEAPTKLERAVAHAHPWLEGLARFGCACKGFVYGIIGAIALWSALNGQRLSARDEAVNQKGILNYLADRPLGEAVLFVLAVGLLGFSLWRMCASLFNPDEKTVWSRMGNLCSGVAYTYVAVLALMVVFGKKANEDEHSTAKMLMHAPWGQWVLAIAGAIVFGVALGQLWIGATTGFKDIFNLRAMPRAQAVMAFWCGRIGFVSRSVLFGIVGGFMIKGALDHRAGEAGGINQAMRRIQHSAGGNVVLGALCFGLICYALFMFFEARYRHIWAADPELVEEIHGPDDEHLAGAGQG